MSDIRVISSRNCELKPIVTAALENESKIISAGIKRTEKRLKYFEEKYKLGSSEFLGLYERDEMDENMDSAEWIGEIRIFERLKEKLEMLQDIEVAN